jgi:hypothetical protein
MTRPAPVHQLRVDGVETPLPVFVKGTDTRIQFWCDRYTLLLFRHRALCQRIDDQKGNVVCSVEDSRGRAVVSNTLASVAEDGQQKKIIFTFTSQLTSAL